MNQQLLSDIGLGIFFLFSIFYIFLYFITNGHPIKKTLNFIEMKRMAFTVIPSFIESLNNGDNLWFSYLTDDAIITSHPNAFYYVKEISDFITYTKQVGSQFTINKFNRKRSTITCLITEENKWIANTSNQLGRVRRTSINHKVIFKMRTIELIESINFSSLPDEKSMFFLSEYENMKYFVSELEIWKSKNNLTPLFTNTTQLICSGQNGAEMVRISEVNLQLAVMDSYVWKAIQRDDYKTAVTHYTNMLNLKPSPGKQYYILRKRAAAYEKLRDYNAAIEDYKTMVAMKDNAPDTSILSILCWDYIITQQPELALPTCNQLITLHPTRISLDLRGIVYGMLGNYQAAITDLTDSDGKPLITQEQRDTWVVQMKNKQNPFTNTVINELRGE